MSWRHARNVAVVCAAVLGWFTTSASFDLPLFAASGRAILTGHWSAVYGGTENQGGPVQNLLAAGLAFGRSDSTVPPVAVALIDAAIMAAALGVPRLGGMRAGGNRVDRRDVAIAAYVLLWLSAPVFWGGHPIEALIPVCWLIAARLDHEGVRRVAVGAVLAVAGAIAPWGVLGWVCLLHPGRLRHFAGTALAASLVTAALYTPFLVAGRDGAVAHRWPVEAHSGLHQLLPELTDVGWDFRVAQAVVVVAGGALCAWWWRHHSARSVLVALAVCLLRIVTDPLSYVYYWVPAGVAATVLLATGPSLRSRAGVVLVVAAYSVWLGGCAGTGWFGALCCLCVLLVAAPAHRKVRQQRTLRSDVGRPMDRRDPTDPSSVFTR